MKKNKKLYYILSLINVALFLIVTTFVYKINSYYDKFVFNIEKLEQLKEDMHRYIDMLQSSYGGKISVYIKDLSTNYEIKINSQDPIPSASILKIPIMAAVYYLVEKGKLSLNEVLIYRKRHRCGGAGVIKNYSYGKRFTVKQLVELMITVSDNIATHMLIERIGIKNLQKIFLDLGLKNTTIERYIMDLKARDKGIENYTTAEDIGELLEKIYRKELVSAEASLEMLLVLMKQRISDRIPKKLPQEVVVAHKTGLMRNVCHDAGIVYTKNGDFIICVLTENIKPSIAKNIISDLAYMSYRLYEDIGTYSETATLREEEINNELKNNNTGDDSGGN